MILQKRRGECTERLWHLQRQVGHELNVLEEAQHMVAALRKEHAERRKALAESRERGETQEMYLDENMANLAKNKESLFHVLKEYSTKRTELIATLFTIFPITELMNSQGLQFMDLRQTLPNLRYLMETLLTTSP
ncbi:hypothetical protein BGX28_010257, partial [Mortierella sp. GBA30]